MLGWFGERLKCSRAALTENPLRTSLLLALLHAKPEHSHSLVLHPLLAARASGKLCRVQGRTQSKAGAADTKSEQHQNPHRLLNPIPGQLRRIPSSALDSWHRAQLSLPGEIGDFGACTSKESKA